MVDDLTLEPQEIAKRKKNADFKPASLKKIQSLNK